MPYLCSIVREVDGCLYLVDYLTRIFHTRVNNTQLDAAPGLPLNIFNFKETLEEDKNDSNKDANCDKDILALVNLLESLLPRCKTIPLSLEHLNKAIFSPCMDDGGKDKEEVAKKEEEKKKKEEDGDKREEEPVPTFINCGTILKRGECQVANGTQLIFDETKLVPGKLFERGLRNLQCVQGLVRSGSLSCQLGGGGGEMKLQMEGVSCLVLSVRKCMFPVKEEQRICDKCRVILKKGVVFCLDGYSSPSLSSFRKCVVQLNRRFEVVHSPRSYIYQGNEQPLELVQHP